MAMQKKLENLINCYSKGEKYLRSINTTLQIPCKIVLRLTRNYETVETLKILYSKRIHASCSRTNRGIKDLGDT